MGGVEGGVPVAERHFREKECKHWQRQLTSATLPPDAMNNNVQVGVAKGSHHPPNRWPWPTRWA